MNRLARSLVVGGITVVVLPLTAASALAANAYRQTNLVADQPGHAMITDTNLVNPWGLAAGPQTPLWVSDNGTGLATIYPGAVGTTPISVAPLVVSIPGGAPTGQVFNPTTGFKLHQGMTTDPALFIFDSEAGKITAWTPTIMPVTGRSWSPTQPERSTKGWRWRTSAIAARSCMRPTSITGASTCSTATFGWAHLPGSFNDPRLPHGYAPFNIQNIDGRLYVAYAKQDATRERRDRRARTRVRGRVLEQGVPATSADQAGRAERAVGAGEGPRGLRQVQPRTAGGQLR